MVDSNATYPSITRYMATTDTYPVTSDVGAAIDRRSRPDIVVAQ